MNNRKRQVLLTAQRLFVDKGFTATSVQDILDESQISKGTFYNYFTSKNECLIAILEYAHDEASIKRRELLIGQDITDKNVLVEQIVTRLHVNREHNLLPIYEAVFYSRDTDLRGFVKKHHLAEHAWLTRRLIDVYGKETTPYATDCAVILLGMIQHTFHFWRASSKEEADVNQLVRFVMRRIDSIIFEMMETKDTLLGSGLLVNLNYQAEKKVNLKQSLLTQLIQFLDCSEGNSKPSGVEYAQFLVDEISSEQPRMFILESVAHTFCETFSDTKYEPEVRELVACLWRYVDTIEK